jgi:hypothetical protein
MQVADCNDPAGESVGRVVLARRMVAGARDRKPII